MTDESNGAAEARQRVEQDTEEFTPLPDDGVPLTHKLGIGESGERAAMPNPTQEQLTSPEFAALWEVMRDWDISAPHFYAGYCGANGSHVALLLNALEAVKRG